MIGFSPVEVDQMTVWQAACAMAPHLKDASEPGDVSDQKLKSMGIEGF